MKRLIRFSSRDGATEEDAALPANPADAAVLGALGQQGTPSLLDGGQAALANIPEAPSGTEASETASSAALSELLPPQRASLDSSITVEGRPSQDSAASLQGAPARATCMCLAVSPQMVLGAVYLAATFSSCTATTSYMHCAVALFFSGWHGSAPVVGKGCPLSAILQVSGQPCLDIT